MIKFIQQFAHVVPRLIACHGCSSNSVTTNEEEKNDNGGKQRDDTGHYIACEKADEKRQSLTDAGHIKAVNEANVGDGSGSEEVPVEGVDAPTNVKTVRKTKGEVKAGKPAHGHAVADGLPPPQEPPVEIMEEREDDHGCTTEKSTTRDKEAWTRKLSILRSSPRKRTLPRTHGK